MIRSVAVISTMLMTIEMELTALASPKSLFISAVNAGAADAMGLNGRIARTCRYSSGSGMRKYSAAAMAMDIL